MTRIKYFYRPGFKKILDPDMKQREYHIKEYWSSNLSEPKVTKQESIYIPDRYIATVVPISEAIVIPIDLTPTPFTENAPPTFTRTLHLRLLSAWEDFRFDPNVWKFNETHQHESMLCGWTAITTDTTEGRWSIDPRIILNWAISVWRSAGLEVTRDQAIDLIAPEGKKFVKEMLAQRRA